jgi:hypothetical protein
VDLVFEWSVTELRLVQCFDLCRAKTVESSQEQLTHQLQNGFRVGSQGSRTSFKYYGSWDCLLITYLNPLTAYPPTQPGLLLQERDQRIWESSGEVKCRRESRYSPTKDSDMRRRHISSGAKRSTSRNLKSVSMARLGFELSDFVDSNSLIRLPQKASPRVYYN